MQERLEIKYFSWKMSVVLQLQLLWVKQSFLVIITFPCILPVPAVMVANIFPKKIKQKRHPCYS